MSGFGAMVFGQITSQLAKSVSDIEFPLWPFISVCFGYIVLFRSGRVSSSLYRYLAAHYMMPFMMMIRRQLGQYMFGHSYRYFQDDYVGSLAGKVMEMPDSIRLIIFNLGHLHIVCCYKLLWRCFYAFWVRILFFCCRLCRRISMGCLVVCALYRCCKLYGS